MKASMQDRERHAAGHPFDFAPYDTDPELLDFLRTKVDSFVKWDLIRFFYNNPNTSNTAGHIARFVGRHVTPVQAELAELAQEGVLQENRKHGGTLYSLTPDHETRRLLDRFVMASEDRSFRVKAIFYITRNQRAKTPSAGERPPDQPLPPSYTLLQPHQEQEVTLRLRDVYAEISDAITKRRIRLYELAPRKFEEFVAAVFENHGYEVQLTKSTRDGGYDIIAIGANPIDQDLRIIVECKRYRPDRPVSISIVRELWGVLTDPANQFDRGIVATTSCLSRDAREAIRTSYWRLREMDSDALMSYAGFEKNSDGLWIPQHLT